MSLTALFLSICLHTQLPCDTVDVAYSGMPSDVLGRATMYHGGRTVIRINRSIQGGPHWLLRNTMLHEVAHLVVWQEYPNKLLSHHGRTFRGACQKLANAYGVSHQSCLEERV